MSTNGYVALEGAASVSLGVIFAFTGSTTYTVTLSTNQQDGGTAVAGADYTAKLATVTSSVHVGSTTFGLTDDGLSEGNETVRAYMNYYTAGGAVAIDVPYRTWVTILDDDRETTGGLGEAASVNRPIVWTTYDNLGEVVATEQFDGDNLAIADEDGMPYPDHILDRGRIALLSGPLIAERGKVFRSLLDVVFRVAIGSQMYAR